jgi:hypothetical protein
MLNAMENLHHNLNLIHNIGADLTTNMVGPVKTDSPLPFLAFNKLRIKLSLFKI